MKWMRRRRPHDDLTTEEARRHLALTKAQQDRVERAVSETKRLQRENHFGERFQRALGGQQ